MSGESPHGCRAGGWDPLGPAVCTAEAAQLIERIVAAVRAGDGVAIRTLLQQLADVADTETLLLQHHRLIEDLHR
ncbi:hypothetical protein [Streptomyces sp. NBC_00199]|uniref:hypothetical protein n=1 Tax=Streptomyces sp. NBC_00199 TaxID=2975678 RepID=UPI00225BDB16|nr:hypothetical protein [Streptomyces sp. NBC_00199]MCX5270029.1 hypothetical protein [Streptomyces sp. NBC_00199]